MTDRWVAGSSASIGRRVIHVEKDCPQLKRASSVREATEIEVEECDVCMVCSGERVRTPPRFFLSAGAEGGG